MDDDLDPRTASLTFPDLPRLQLDQLLAQLVERTHEVIATQGRLRGLLRANQMVTGDLALPVLLHHIVDAARELVGARYAALGVNARTGGLAQFVHRRRDRDVGPRHLRQPGQGLPHREGGPGYDARDIVGKGSVRAVLQADITLTGVRVPAGNVLPGARSFKDAARVLASPASPSPGARWATPSRPTRRR